MEGTSQIIESRGRLISDLVEEAYKKLEGLGLGFEQQIALVCDLRRDYKGGVHYLAPDIYSCFINLRSIEIIKAIGELEAKIMKNSAALEE